MSALVREIVSRVAPGQHGLVTRRQLTDAHVPARTIDNNIQIGSLEIVHPGVYRACGSPKTWLQTVLAATLSAGDGAAAGARTAAALWSLLPVPGQPVEVIVPLPRHPRGHGYVVHRTRRPFEVAAVHRIPTTTAARTLDDISRVVSRRTLEEVMDKALFRGLTTVNELGRIGGVVADLAAERSPRRVQSVLETRFLRILRDGDLPEPVVQFEVRRGGVLLAVADFAYPAERLLIEINGYEFHSSRRAFDRASWREKALQDAGYLVVPFTATELGRPAQVVASVRRRLYERGHPNVVSA